MAALEKTIYRVTFERIGRSVGNTLWPKTEDFVATSADELATVIFTYARQYLMSNEFDVMVNLEEGKGSIGYGRFGTFTIEAV